MSLQASVPVGCVAVVDGVREILGEVEVSAGELMEARTPVQKPLLSEGSKAGALADELACLSVVA